MCGPVRLSLVYISTARIIICLYVDFVFFVFAIFTLYDDIIYIYLYTRTTGDYIIIIIAVDVVLEVHAGDISSVYTLQYIFIICRYSLYNVYATLDK